MSINQNDNNINENAPAFNQIEKQLMINNKYDRVVVLIDMDCFYCQVEEKLDPTLQGKPIAVVQYNTWQGGGIIAVNYPARAKGVSRQMRGDEAKKNCPDIQLVHVPSIGEKADLTKYRDAGKEVANVLQTFTPLLEKASVDEAYLDITETVLKRLAEMNQGNFRIQPQHLLNTYAVGFNTIGQFVKSIYNPANDDFNTDEDKEVFKKSDIMLLVASSIVNEIREAVKIKTGYDCSAGIGHNKILAKLICGFNKPNKQTLIPVKQVPEMFQTLAIGKVKGLGGKFGEEVCENLQIKYMGDLLQFSEATLKHKFDEKKGSWLFQIARGIELEKVTPRFTSKSIGCSKKFPGKNAITGIATLNHWLHELSKELVKRLETDLLENNRLAKQLTISFTQTINKNEVPLTRSISLISYDIKQIAADAFETIKKNTNQFYSKDNNQIIYNSIKFLGLSVGKFESNKSKKNLLQEMFKMCAKENEEHAYKPDIKEVKSSVEINKNIVNNTEENKVLIEIENSTEVTPPQKLSFFQEHLIKKQNCIEKIKENKVFESNEKLNMDNKEEINVENDTKEAITVKKVLSKEIEEIQLNEKDTNEIIINMNDKSNENLPSTSTDYRSTYIEYYKPPQIDESYVTCKKCSQTILEYDLISHMDYHFALEISQEQRITYRNEVIKINKNKSPVSNKKAKTEIKPKSEKCNENKKHTVASIKKFLVKSTELEEASLKTNVSYEICNECNNAIPFDQVAEHADHHMAKRLQVELNKTDAMLNATIKLPPKIPNVIGSNKRKRSENTDKSKSALKIKTKNVASYFN